MIDKVLAEMTAKLNGEQACKRSSYIAGILDVLFKKNYN